MTPTGLTLTICCLIALVFGFATASINIQPNPKTLIYYVQPDFKTTFSTLLASLENRGHVITLTNPLDDTAALKNYDRLQFDNIFVFAPHASKGLQGFPTTSDFLDFVQSGGSLFIAPSNGIISDTLRDIGLAYGIEYLPSSAVAMSTNDPSNAVLNLSLPPTNSVILGSTTEMAQNGIINAVGLGMAVIDNVAYIKKVLTGSANMVIFDPHTHQIYETGNNISFLTALQLKNNARIIFFSDVSLLSNPFLSNNQSTPTTTTTSHNNLYLNTVCWVTHDCGHVRIKKFQHYLFAPSDQALTTNGYLNSHKQLLSNPADPAKFTRINPASYKVGDNVHFDVVLEQYNPMTKQWDPIASPDLVFDMTMLHSFIRFPIELNASSTLTAKQNSLLSNQQDRDANTPVELSVPDTMGVYRVSVSTRDAFSSQRGAGSSFLSLQEDPLDLPIRPFEHTEWARFLFVAYPYYISMAITMGAFFILSVAFMYTK